MIPISSVDIGQSESDSVLEALRAGWISGTGPSIGMFEQRLAEQVDRSHAIAVANGTLGLELALRALDIRPGDEVIVPALTFASPAMSVLAIGAEPVITDVTPDTWTLAPDQVARRLTSRTKAIIAVDVLGHPADYDEILTFGLPVIEDACEAHGASYKGRPVGSLGDISVFSFYANKTITTGEGGAVCTDSAALHEWMRTTANHGMRPESRYVHETLGRNYRMTNLTAAIGLAQLGRWDELVAGRRQVASKYDALLADAHCTTRPRATWADWSCWLYVATVQDRDKVVGRMRDDGIDARPLWPALSEQPVLAPWRSSCPVAEEVARQSMFLPTFLGLSDADIAFVAQSLTDATA